MGILQECKDLLEKEWNTKKKSAVQVLDDLGMLSNRTVLAHCVHMTFRVVQYLQYWSLRFVSMSSWRSTSKKMTSSFP